jgi:hypothetical protein
MKNNMSITAKITRAIVLLLTVFSMSACSTYPSKFKCGDAKGLGCTMLAEVDKQIDSGKIAEAYKDKKKCRGNKCSSLEGEGELTLNRGEKARFGKLTTKNRSEYLSDDDEKISILDDDNNLYF